MTGNQSHRGCRFAGATLFVAAVVCFSLAPQALCQEAVGHPVSGGAIQGEVRDAAGLPVPGAS